MGMDQYFSKCIMCHNDPSIPGEGMCEFCKDDWKKKRIIFKLKQQKKAYSVENYEKNIYNSQLIKI
jgi:recombinational DNA repair protein RecR